MTDFTPLARIDSFAYRHRLAEVMTTPVLTGARAMSLGEACDRMYAIKASSLVVVDDDGRALGIVTERDLLRVLSAQRGAALEMAVGDVMSAPV
ncbi:MAG: CBS domain-containing protein, partial [Sphingomonas sp.]|nr:CBS domain-containing protein [Sphingomonas sp.]